MLLPTPHHASARDQFAAAGIFVLAAFAVTLLVGAVLQWALDLRGPFWDIAGDALVVVPASLWLSRRKATLGLAALLATVLVFLVSRYLLVIALLFPWARTGDAHLGWMDFAQQVLTAQGGVFVAILVAVPMLAAVVWHFVLPAGRTRPGSRGGDS